MSEEKAISNEQYDAVMANDFGKIWQRAQAYASSSMVPEQFRNNPANCMIAIEMAYRINASIFATMQSLAIVKGKPSFSAQFLIGCFNTSGKYSPLRFEWLGGPNDEEWGCRACAKDLRTGETLYGAWVTKEMAMKEGWWSKKDSKGNEISQWQTMPEQMFRYRAATFLIRAYAPEISLGMQTADELQDINTTATVVDKREELREEVKALSEKAQVIDVPVQEEFAAEAAPVTATAQAATAMAEEKQEVKASRPSWIR